MNLFQSALSHNDIRSRVCTWVFVLISVISAAYITVISQYHMRLVGSGGFGGLKSGAKKLSNVMLPVSCWHSQHPI